MKATREALTTALETAPENVIVLSADLSKATGTAKFKDAHPDRFIECGIAEANMIGIASGISEYGKRPVISSFASFLTGRYDIIRCSLAYSEAPVLLVGTHGGLAIGKDGVTQMGLEDISLMRSLPNMHVYNPATYNEALAVAKYLLKTKQLAYLRLGRQPVEELFDDNLDFSNKIQKVSSGNGRVVVFSTGCILPEVVKAVTHLDKKPDVYNVTCLKPLDNEGILRACIEAKDVITVEDHSIIGGLGTAISDLLSEKLPRKVTKIGVNDVFPESGSPDDLYKKYGLDSFSISEKIKQVWNSNLL